jgi:ACS family tartrate transporter-like MFS transporter
MREQDQIFAKCARRLIPFLVLLQVAYVLDRVNVGFAALTMNRDLGFSPTVFGFGAGVFFIGYFLFAVPANLILERVGARRWVFFIMAAWGAISAAGAFVQGPVSFYALRFLLGTAEAGFIPGIVLYLTYWFPHHYRARFTASFIAAAPLSSIVGGPLSGLILGLDGSAGFHGWQWLFLLEGLPACVLAFVTLGFLPDGPKNAPWLTVGEKQEIAMRLAAEDNAEHGDFWLALRDPRLFAFGVVLLGIYMALFAYVLWLPQIVKAMGFSNRATGFVTALPYVVSIIAMILWGRSSDARNERVWHVALATLLAAAGFIAASLAQSYVLVLVALTVAASAGFSALGPFYSLLSSFLRGTAAAGGIAFVNAVGTGLGGFIGPVVVGMLKQQTGGYASGMVALATGLVLSAALVILMEHLKRPAVTV